MTKSSKPGKHVGLNSAPQAPLTASLPSSSLAQGPRPQTNMRQSPQNALWMTAKLHIKCGRGCRAHVNPSPEPQGQPTSSVDDIGYKGPKRGRALFAWSSDLGFSHAPLWCFDSNPVWESERDLLFPWPLLPEKGTRDTLGAKEAQTSEEGQCLTRYCGGSKQALGWHRRSRHRLCAQSVNLK